LTSDDSFLTLDDMSLIRGTSLHGFVELTRELGGNPVPLLDRAHVPVEAVGDHDTFIAIRGVIAVLEEAAKATGTPDFGRRLAMRQGLDILGPLGVAARTAATVGAALQSVEQYLSIYSPGLSVAVQPVADQRLACFEWRLLLDRPPPHQQATELGVAVSVRVFRLLAGDDFVPMSVHFRHDALGDPAEYVRHFGCRTSFGTPFHGFLFRRSVLDRRLPSDSSVHRVVQEYLNSIALPTDAHVTEPVRSLIRRLLPTGGLDLDVVSRHLALHPRTLQRQLAAQGSSFAALVDDVRRSDAERYLRDTDIPLGQLAGILGYSEQSVLSRSCQRWFGMSASAYRKSPVPGS
jgi:AraC-like DNA-binding protein